MKKVHFLGIAGSGASAAAAVAKTQGYQISGCDANLTGDFIKSFKDGQLFKGHSPTHLKNIDILATTPAVFSLDPKNPELQAAKKLGIPVMTWQEFTGKFLEKDKYVIAVCGTHGKSTTTAMIGKLLEDAGLDPTVELGAIVPHWQANYRIGRGKYFVIEADEFNDNFLFTKPDITIVTAIEMDHPEYFASYQDYQNSFRKFLSQTKEKIIANFKDRGVEEVLKEHEVEIIDYSNQLIDFPLQIAGEYNRQNASAAYQAGIALGIDPGIIQTSLASFSGIGRRFEYLGDFKDAGVYSDFAHHPTEIKVTMEAARQKFPNQKIIMVFQPHMFSRTHELFNDFVTVFQNIPADEIYLLDIYPSREIDTGLVNSQQLVNAINKKPVQYIASSAMILSKLKKEAETGDVIFFVGAGDIHNLAKRMVNK